MLLKIIKDKKHKKEKTKKSKYVNKKKVKISNIF